MLQKGLLSGFTGRTRQHGVTRPPQYLGPLVFHPIDNLDLIAAGTVTADLNTTLTADCSGLGGGSVPGVGYVPAIPADGSVVGLMVSILGKCSSVSTTTYVEIGDYTSARAVGSVPAGDSVQFWQCYCAKVASHYDSLTVGIVYTGGKNNTQFKYAISWSAGTVTYYLRIHGYWTRAR